MSRGIPDGGSPARGLVDATCRTAAPPRIAPAKEIGGRSSCDAGPSISGRLIEPFPCRCNLPFCPSCRYHRLHFQVNVGELDETDYGDLISASMTYQPCTSNTPRTLRTTRARKRSRPRTATSSPPSRTTAGPPTCRLLRYGAAPAPAQETPSDSHGDPCIRGTARYLDAPGT